MGMKKCTKCQIEKEKTEYYKHKNGKDGLNPVCKVCWKEENKIFEQNKPRTEYRKTRYNIIKPEHNKKVASRSQERYKNDIEYKLLKLTRTRLHHFLKGKHKAETTKAILGIDLTEYKLYLENKFTLEMNWENYGIYWEIDHIIPLSKGGSFHYTNTQPLTITENRKKSNKLF